MTYTDTITTDTITTDTSATTSTWTTLRRIHTHLTRHLDTTLDQHCAINLTTYEILNTIHHSQTSRRLIDLLDTIPLSQAALSRRIDKLEAQGLIKRQPDPRDRRGTILTLTEAGRNLHTTATPIHRTAIAKHLPAHLTPSRLAQLSPSANLNR